MKEGLYFNSNSKFKNEYMITINIFIKYLLLFSFPTIFFRTLSKFIEGLLFIYLKLIIYFIIIINIIILKMDDHTCDNTQSTYINEHKEHNDNNDNNEEMKEEKQKIYSTHTKFCSFGIQKCKKGTNCIFAHTFKELNPIICKWDNECLRKEKCYYKHTNETKVQYVKRAFPEDIKRLNIIIYEHQSNKPPKNKKKNRKSLENEDPPFDYEKYSKLLSSLIRMYHDPIFERYDWADADEFDTDFNLSIDRH
jgi:hypothetical protein